MSSRLEELKTALKGQYEIERELGAGGMATVYLADDLKHQRQVAIKVLRPDLAAALGPDRFLREIRIAANLTHPHILPLHDSGEADGFLYYVMPFIEGQTLRDRIDKEGELPIAETIRIIREVTDALAFAHSKGVVHRDIKPDNIMLTGGHAIVADFGVAKAVSEATGSDKLTTAGVALGTPAYMSPEQATADPHVDHRADIYAVGAMAYELLAGRTPFIGATPQSILAAHVTEQVEPVSKYRDQVSVELEALIMKCLAKKPADRWQSAGDMLPHLETLGTSSGGLTPAATIPVSALPGKAQGKNAALAVGAIMGVVLVAVVGWSMLSTSPPQVSVVSASRVTRDPGLEIHPSISPDGREVAYVAGPLGSMKLFVQDTESRSKHALTEGLDGGEVSPRWLNDGRRIGFESDVHGISSVPRNGGSPRRVSESEMDMVVVNRDSVFVRDPESVGGVRLIATEVGHQIHSLKVSPDNQLAVYVSGNENWNSSSSFGNTAPSAIVAITIPGGTITPLTDSSSLNVSPVWSSDGRHVFYISDRGGARDIYVQRVNARGAPVGDAAALTIGGLSAHSISLSADDNTLAYSEFTFSRNVWSIPVPTGETVSIDEAVQLTHGSQIVESVSVTPDGQWMVFDSDLAGNHDIYRMRLPDGDPVQITTDPALDFHPSISDDGGVISFHSYRNGAGDVFVVSATAGSPELVSNSDENDWVSAISPDGLKVAWRAVGTLDGTLLSTRTSLESPWSDPSPYGALEVGHAVEWFVGADSIIYSSRSRLHSNSFYVKGPGGEGRLIFSSNLNGLDRVGYPILNQDDSRIYFTGVHGDQRKGIWSVTVGGDDLRQDVAFDNPAMANVWVFLAMDQDNIYMTIAKYESDIHVLRLSWE